MAWAAYRHRTASHKPFYPDVEGNRVDRICAARYERR
jgi:hypothetical protein